jgi:hypothetical protein
MNSHPSTCSSKKYCLFHKYKGYDTEYYYVLKKKIERLIAKCYLHWFLKKDFCPGQNMEEPSQSVMTLPENNVILGGTYAGGDSNNEKGKYGKQILTTTRSLN